MKRLFLIPLLLLLAPLARAGQTIVTATITDPNGQRYANGSGRGSIVCPGNAAPTFNGFSVTRTTVINGLDGFGTFTQTFFDTSTLDQTGCGYQFSITDQTTTVSFTTPTLFTVTGISVNLSTQISSFAAPLPTSGGGGGGLQNVSSLPILCTPGITNPVNLTTFPYGVYACTSLNTWTSWTIGSNGQINRFQPVLGTALTSTDFSLSGWGSGATIGSITGTDTDFQYTITAGTAPSSDPTVILTYHDGPWISITSASSWMTNGSGVIQDIASSSTITAMTMTYTGIPIAGSTYIINGLVMGNANTTNFPVSVNPVIVNPTASQTITQPGGTSLSIIGSLLAQMNNGVCNPLPYSGADISAKVVTAFSSCSSVKIPPGVYNSVTTTLAFPIASNGTSVLDMRGVTINYTGSGIALDLAGNNNGNVNAVVLGGIINGTSSGTSGVRIRAFASTKVYETQVRGFTTGDGFFHQGGNTIDCFSCVAEGNSNGVHNVGVAIGPNLFAANAIHWHGGLIQLNTNQGWFEDAAQVSVVGANQNNTTEGTTFEANGINGSSTTAQVFIQQCVNCSIDNDYFEPAVGAEPLNVIILGDSTHQAQGINIKGNFFASFGATNTIEDVNSSHTNTEHNTEFIADTNFYNHGTLSSGTSIGCNAVASTNYLTGVDTGGDTISNCNASTQTFPNFSAPGPSGYRFNQLSGYNQDLTVRTRSGGVYNIQGQDINDTRRTWGVTDFGAGELTGLYSSGTPNLTASTCGTLASSQGGNWVGAVNSGTTGTCVLVITPGFTAPHGFHCSATNMASATNTMRQTSFSTTTCTLTGTTTSGDTLNWIVEGF